MLSSPDLPRVALSGKIAAMVDAGHGLRTRAATLGAAVGSLWLVRLVDVLTPGGGSVAGHGIVPRTWYGLAGILSAPFIHASVAHLVANTIPLLILGALVLWRRVSELLFVVVTSALGAGLGTWLFGAPNTMHVGASGVVFGLFGYLLFRMFFDRRLTSAVVTLLVAVLYGTAMLRSLVPEAGISWSGHFFGFLAGVLAARLRYPARADAPPAPHWKA
jgi:membrane associated rhomboid family serine protease